MYFKVLLLYSGVLWAYQFHKVLHCIRRPWLPQNCDVHEVGSHIYCTLKSPTLANISFFSKTQIPRAEPQNWNLGTMLANDCSAKDMGDRTQQWEKLRRGMWLVCWELWGWDCPFQKETLGLALEDKLSPSGRGLALGKTTINDWVTNQTQLSSQLTNSQCRGHCTHLSPTAKWVCNGTADSSVVCHPPLGTPYWSMTQTWDSFLSTEKLAYFMPQSDVVSLSV